MITTASDATEWDVFAPTKVGTDGVSPDQLEWGDEVMLRELGELFTPEEGEVPPSEAAFHVAVELIEQTGSIMYCHLAGMRGEWWEFPEGYVATDDNGGLHIEWWHSNTHCVALRIGHTAKPSVSAFVKMGSDDSGKLTRGVHPAWLATKLAALNKAT
jgi:hypothetical protein